MKVHDVIQGDPSWYQIRAGIPTASQFHRVVTPGGKKADPKPSEQAGGYIYELIAERAMGRSVDVGEDAFQSFWMRRGKALEGEARAYYKIRRGLDLKTVGFITNDAGTVGVSPDALAYEADGVVGGVEIKCPSDGVQVQYLFHEEDRKHRPQVQGYMWIAEVEWVDVLAYHPELPKALVRIERDDAYIKVLEREMGAFLDKLESKWAEYQARNEAA